MADDFWHRAWRSPRTGRNKADPHPDLVAHAVTEFVGAVRLLVPFCGRSPDLLWLAERWPEVVGVELVDEAVAGFADLAVREPVAGFRRYGRDGLTVLLGDFHDAKPGTFGTFDGAWDRGAFGALPAARRPPYVRVLRSLLRPGSTVLLEGYTFDQRRLSGPPFSVRDAELCGAFPDCGVRVLADRRLENRGRYPAVPLERWRQRVYAIELPSGS